jgi:hypothetical protein
MPAESEDQLSPGTDAATRNRGDTALTTTTQAHSPSPRGGQTSGRRSADSRQTGTASTPWKQLSRPTTSERDPGNGSFVRLGRSSGSERSANRRALSLRRSGSQQRCTPPIRTRRRSRLSRSQQRHLAQQSAELSGHSRHAGPPKTAHSIYTLSICHDMTTHIISGSAR